MTASPLRVRGSSKAVGCKAGKVHREGRGDRVDREEVINRDTICITTSPSTSHTPAIRRRDTVSTRTKDIISRSSTMGLDLRHNCNRSIKGRGMIWL